MRVLGAKIACCSAWCLLFVARQLVTADSFLQIAGGIVEQESLSLDEYVLVWAWRGSQVGDYALGCFLIWDVIMSCKSIVGQN